MSRAGMDSEPKCQGVGPAVDRMTNKLESVKTIRGDTQGKSFNSMIVLPEALSRHQAVHLGASSYDFGVLVAWCSSHNVLGRRQP